MTQFYIDHSQYYKFTGQCPWRWYENYVTQRAKTLVGLQDNALCIGKLVHNGLENFYKKGDTAISASAIDEATPTREALFMAHLLVDQYAQNYQSDPAAKLTLVEEPIIKPLTKTFSLLAKIDVYMYVEKDTEISIGWEGETTTLSKGWWIKEHKTKSASIKMPAYIKAWQANMQADFQLLALTHKLQQPIQGVLINVLEKPNIYQPKRKCKSCSNIQPFSAYTTVATSIKAKYKCPLCGAEQDLAPLKQTTNTPTAKFYRFPVTRSPERLFNRSLPEILQIANAMQNMMENGIFSVPPWRPNCVVRGQTCPYFELHNTVDGTIIKNNPDFSTIDATAYMGLPK